MDLDPLRQVAVRAVAAGGAVVRDLFAREGTAGTSKGTGDYVTAVDRSAEIAILDVLREYSPDIPVLAEEGGGAQGERFWAVDPLDGTTNYMRGYPVVGVSVGLMFEGFPVVGAVEAPLLGERWSAARGLGAHDGYGRPLRVRDASTGGVVSTGFPFRRPENRPRYRAVFDRALEQFEDLRRPGAASLDLAYVAAGVFDGFFELGLSLWDIAAGVALVREAGGVVSDWDGDGKAAFTSGDVFAGSPAWHERMMTIVRNTKRASRLGGEPAGGDPAAPPAPWR